MNSEQPDIPYFAKGKISQCQTTLTKALILSSRTLSSRISDDIPELTGILSKSKRPQSDWEFFFIAGGAGLAMRHPECPDILRKKILDDIELVDHQMVEAVENLYGFVDDGGDDVEILPAIGMWVLWNIGQERPSHEESKLLAPAIGLILNKVVTDCFVEE